MEKQRIGVAVIAKNEADRIGRMLDSVRFADDVVVMVDDSCTDDTADVCRKWGARVVNRPWEGFAAQKQAAMDAVSAEWVISLDADEVMTPELASEIRAVVDQSPSGTNGYAMPRLSRYLGRWIRHGGWYPDRKVRLVRKGRGRWHGEGLHERIVVQGKVGRLHHPFLHYVYRDIADQLKTIDKFSTIHAETAGARGSGTVFWGVLHAVGKFFECYFWKAGVLDGSPGLIIAMNSAWYVFLKHAKMWEKGRRRSHSGIGPYP